MNESQDLRWHNLLALSAPTFAPDATPPYGFTTRVLAQLLAEKRQNEMLNRLGLRALFASLGLLLVTVLVSFSVEQLDGGDFDPGVRSILQVENLPFS